VDPARCWPTAAPRTNAATGIAVNRRHPGMAPGRPPSLLDGKQFDLENQLRVGRDLGERALTAVAQRGRNPQLPLSPDHHERYSLVPARNDLAHVELEGEGLAAQATVNFLAVLQPA